ncbi:MAG: hypothetical protein AB7N76_27950 [Planctomycetota bacterium]
MANPNQTLTTSAPGDYSVYWPASIIGFALLTMLLNFGVAIAGKCHYRAVQDQMDRPAAQAPAEPAPAQP